jgi:hypothetical protein
MPHSPALNLGWFVADPAQLYRSKHRQLYAYWDGKRPAAGRLPARRHLDPVELRALLPYLWLLDVGQGRNGATFRTRLSGTATTALYGVEPTGLWFEELYAEPYLSRQLATYRAVVAAARPHLSRLTVPLHGREHCVYDRLILPLATDGATVDMLLGIHAYEAEPGENPADWPAAEKLSDGRLRVG